MLRDPTESYAQRLLITALGDYEDLVPDPIPSAGLVRMMDEFDISVDSARAALSRLVRRDYLDRFTEGRRTAYRLSSFGSQLVSEAKARMEEFGTPRPWDGHWTLVAFSVAEAQRSARHVLRTHLRALGFAPFYDGMWIAAHADPDQVGSQLAEVENVDVAIFDGQILNLSDTMLAKLQQTWKLSDIRAEYEDFIETFTPLAERVSHDEVAPSEAFIARTRLMDAWRVFPRTDPDLPEGFLPADWPRVPAHELFSTIYEALRPTAEIRFKSFLTLS